MWLGTWPTSRAKTCTWFSGFLALAGPDEAVVALTLRSARRSGGFMPPWRGKLAGTSARTDLKALQHCVAPGPAGHTPEPSPR